jgi:cytochrome b561
MKPDVPVQYYSTRQKISHWIIVILCVLEFPTAEGIRKSHAGHAFGVKAPLLDQLGAAVHEWGGWLILALVAVLIVSRFVVGAPRLPSGMRSWQRLFAHFVHTAIYLGLVALVASGVVAMYVSGRYAFLHILLAKAGIGLISVHVAAALWHQFIRRDHLLTAMLPSRKRR